MAQSLPRVLVLTRIGGFLKPSNGGQLRTHHLLRRICEYGHVDVFNPGMHQIVTESEEWCKLGLQSLITPNWLTLLSKLRLKRGWSRTIQTVEQTLFHQDPDAEHVDFATWWVNRLMRSPTRYDIIILDTLSLPPLKSWKSTARRVWLNAHNVESELNPTNTQILQLEKNLSKLIDGVIACTPNDALRFKHLNQDPLQTLVWPNGTAYQPNPKSIPEVAKAIFIGSLNYPPNVDGLNWYFEQIHPLILKEVPQFELMIVGRSPSPEDFQHWKNQPNTAIHTNVDSISPYLNAATFSIVPLLHGSGSRLKIADSLMHGRPVISTAIGAEGYDTNTLGLTQADQPQDFAARMIHSLLNPRKLKASEIHDWANDHLSWDVTIKPEQIMTAP